MATRLVQIDGAWRAMSADHMQIDPDVNVSREVILAHCHDRAKHELGVHAQALRREEVRIPLEAEQQQAEKRQRGQRQDPAGAALHEGPTPTVSGSGAGSSVFATDTASAPANTRRSSGRNSRATRSVFSPPEFPRDAVAAPSPRNWGGRKSAIY